MGYSPFPASLATLAKAKHKASEDNRQGRVRETPSTCQPWPLAHGQPWRDGAVLLDAA